MSQPDLVIGVSLKMYFGQRQTLGWCHAVAALAARHPAVTQGAVDLFVLPAAPLIDPVLRIFAGTPVRVGAQNLHWEDSGAFTGEVSGALLRELGCRYAEVNHAERRRLFGEDDATAAAKVAACRRNGLVPVLCVGEDSQSPPGQAAATVIAQARQILGPAGSGQNRVILAYEPHWAIGQPEAAPAGHIADVTGALRRWLASRPELAGSRVIYGGSAGLGLLGSIRGSVDGLFLGRFAHDPAALEAILDEAGQAATSSSSDDAVAVTTQ